MFFYCGKKHINDNFKCIFRAHFSIVKYMHIVVQRICRTLLSLWLRLYTFGTTAPSFPLPTSPGSHPSALFLWIWLYQTSHINGIIHSLLFFNFLFSLSIMSEISSMLWHRTEFPSFSRVNNILFYVYTIFSLSVIFWWTFRLFPHLGYSE